MPTDLPQDLRNQANGLGQYTPRTEAEKILDAVRGLAEGAANLVGDGIDASVTNLTSALGSAGALTGKYYYSFTFVSAFGETAPWPGTAVAVTAAAQRINLTNIPIGPAGTIARRIYRTPNTPDGTAYKDPKDYRFVAEIADNTTTTYTDNTADGSLGSPVSWNATNRGVLTDGVNVLVRASDQSTQVGFQAFGTGFVGYASTAIGFQVLASNTTGRRNVGVGTYSLNLLTIGYENTAGGVHSLNNLVDGIGWTAWGYAAGQNNAGTVTGKNFGTVIGHRAYQNGGGSGVTVVGALAGCDANTADNLLCLGFGAGRRASASREIYLDNQDRTTNANEKDIGLMYGKTQGTAISQELRLNAITRLGPVPGTVAALTAAWPAAVALAGFRAFVTDANSTAFAAALVGGGANGVPVYCDGTTWRVG